MSTRGLNRRAVRARSDRTQRILQARAAAALLACVAVPPAAADGSDAPQAATPAGFRWFGLEPAPLTEPLVTDRPDFTESADAVPRGHIQLEMGYTFTHDREGRERTRDHTAPELLLRIGLVDDFELRLGWDGYSWQDQLFDVQRDSGFRLSVEDHIQGSNDVSIGLKYKLFEQEGARPHLGVIAELSMPSGTPEFSAGDVEPAAILCWAYDLDERWALAGNVGVGAVRGESNRFAQATSSVSLAYALSERWGSYAEYFGIYPNADGSDCAHSVNGGLTYLISDNLQVDLRVGAGLNEEADDFFAGAGFAWRW